MSRTTITRTQFEAVRTAELAEDNGAPSGDVLAGHYLISATTPTAAVLVRLGLAENIKLTSAGTEFVFPALTRAGEVLRERLEVGGPLPRLSSIEDIHRSVELAARGKAYTVVLDWDGEATEPPVVQIYAHSELGAIEAAREAAWYDWAGQVDEIPVGAAYDESMAEDLWYSVVILDGHVNVARF